MFIMKELLKKGSDEVVFNIFDFELSQEDMEAITKLDTKQSLFFSHHDPEMVKWIGTNKLDIEPIDH